MTRKAIRDYIKNAIESMALTSIVKVKAGRQMQIDAAATPIVMVYFDEGNTEKVFLEGTKETDAFLNIEIITADVVNVDDALDAIGDKIEAIFETDDHKNIGGLVKKFIYKQFAYTRDDQSSLAALTLTYAINYHY